MAKTPWEIARSQLIDNVRNHYNHDAFFALTEPALIDPVIQRVLDRKYGGQMPEEEKAITRVTRRAVGSYGSLKWTDEGRAWLENRMEERYRTPAISQKGALLIADFGDAPGKLEEQRRGIWKVQTSWVTLGESWKTTEVAAALHELGEAYPHRAISAYIRIPLGNRSRKWEYRWIRGQDRIAIKRDDVPNWVWVTGSLNDDLGPYIRGEASLLPKDLTKQTMVTKVWGETPDAPI
ncbi:MAG: hypothetical protein GWP91_07800 [Rhodobacterales bacterium]|nr:hypothetical protein [Rhodobacterales bacterium]